MKRQNPINALRLDAQPIQITFQSHHPACIDQAMIRADGYYFDEFLCLSVYRVSRERQHDPMIFFYEPCLMRRFDRL